MVMNVSVKRELMTFSSPVWEWSGSKAEAVVTAEALPKILDADAATRELVEDVLEVVLGRWGRAARGDLEGANESAPWLEVRPRVPPPLEKSTLVPEAFLPLCSAKLLIVPPSCAPSSGFAFNLAVVEVVESFRARFLELIMPKSSVVPGIAYWDCSTGWDKAEVNASRTGKGVRLRIWMAVMCRIRLWLIKSLVILRSLNNTETYWG